MPRKSPAPGADYTVGYGRPPVNTRFRPGQSGNPRGRPRRAAPAGELPPGLDPLSEATLRILSEKVAVRVEGGRRRVSGEEAILLAQRERALEGDLRSARFLLERWEEAQARAAQIEAQSPDGESVGKMLASLTNLLMVSKSLGFDDIDAFCAAIEGSALASAGARSADPPAEASEDRPEADAVAGGEAEGPACEELPASAGGSECGEEPPEADPAERHGEAPARPAASPRVDPPPVSRRAGQGGPLIQPGAPLSLPGYGVGGTAQPPPGKVTFD